MGRKILKILLIFVICFLIICTAFIPCVQKTFLNSMKKHKNKNLSNVFSTSTHIISAKENKNNNFERGTILYVGGYGPNNYSSIQQAIDNSNNTDTIFIYNESSPYYENLNIINSISLIGEDKKTTIIDGYKNNDVIKISANNVIIENLCIKNSSSTGVGIKIQSYFNQTIKNSNITNNHGGISLINSANNSITNCSITNSTIAILIDDSEYNKITNNFIKDNNFGVELYVTSTDNTFYHNSFFNNALNAYDPSNNNWDNGYPSGGNYWDDYQGDDIYNGPNQDILGSDHIGDIPYLISPGNNYDNYPLIAMYGPPYADYVYDISNKTIFLNASLSFDYDGYIVSYEWIFYDGNTKFGKIVNHTYDEYGIYNILLKIYDNNGKIGRNIKSILIDNQPPIIQDNTPLEGTAGSPFTFNATVTDIIISDVYVIFWFDSGLHNNLSMDNTGENIWQKTININMTSETLFYMITAIDGAGNTASTGLKVVNIIPNSPPNIPNNPDPNNGEKNVDLNIDLSWTGGDSDFDDTVYYDVYFDTTNPPEYLKTIGPFPGTQDIITCDIETLNYGITYYWQIIARDNHGINSTEPSEIWSFTTTKIGVRIIHPQNVLVVGGIDITAEVLGPGEIDRLEFFIDNKSLFVDYDSPYIFSWNPLICFKTSPFSFNRVIKVTAYDKQGNFASDEITIFKWRLHPVIILASFLLFIRLVSRIGSGFNIFR